MNNVFYGYARVSTVGQNDTSIEAQLEYLRLQAESLPMPFEGHFEKKSGKNIADRDVLQYVIEKAASGDVVAVYDNSRLGRNTEENLATIKMLHSKGVRVQINSKFIDPNNPDDELLFSIQSSISTFQRKTQLLKSRAGINVKKRNGDWVMRGDLFGYKITTSGKKTTAEIVESEAAVIRYIFKRYSEGASIKKITEELNSFVEMKPVGESFYAASIRRIIFKPIYMGYYLVENQLHKNLPKLTRNQVEEQLVKSNIYPPIIDEELWWSVFTSYRKVKRKHTKQYEYRFSYYELSSVMRCGYCDAAYVHSFNKTANKVYEYYSCLAHKKECRPASYNLPYKNYELLMRATMYMTFSDPFELSSFFSEKKAVVDASSKQMREVINTLKQRQEEIDKRKQNLIDAVEEGVLSIADIKKRLAVFDKELTEIGERIRSMEFNLNNDEEELSMLLNETRIEEIDAFRHSDNAFRRGKYVALLDSAKVYRGRLIVRYKNGKTFAIVIDQRNRKYSQKIYKITVGYKGVIQYSCTVNTEETTITVDTPSTTDSFVQYYYSNIAKSIEAVEQLIKQDAAER